MRLYVKNYNLTVSNQTNIVREMGLPRVVGVLRGSQDFNIQCELIPILDEGESAQDILERLAVWLNGTEINMVMAKPDKPRCFYCGGMLENGNVTKCKNCGAEVR